MAFTDVYCTYLLYFYYCFNFKVIASHNPNWVVKLFDCIMLYSVAMLYRVRL